MNSFQPRTITYVLRCNKLVFTGKTTLQIEELVTQPNSRVLLHILANQISQLVCILKENIFHYCLLSFIDKHEQLTLQKPTSKTKNLRNTMNPCDTHESKCDLFSLMSGHTMHRFLFLTSSIRRNKLQTS